MFSLCALIPSAFTLSPSDLFFAVQTRRAGDSIVAESLRRVQRVQRLRVEGLVEADDRLFVEGLGFAPIHLQLPRSQFRLVKGSMGEMKRK